MSLCAAYIEDKCRNGVAMMPALGYILVASHRLPVETSHLCSTGIAGLEDRHRESEIESAEVPA